MIVVNPDVEAGTRLAHARDCHGSMIVRQYARAHALAVEFDAVDTCCGNFASAPLHASPRHQIITALTSCHVFDRGLKSSGHGTRNLSVMRVSRVAQNP